MDNSNKVSIMNKSFNNIEKEFNELLNNEIKINESLYPDTIKSNIYKTIKDKYIDLEISSIDRYYNKFKIIIPYKNDFKDIKVYDYGEIEVEFKISTSKTDKLEKDYKGKRKYTHIQRCNPVKFLNASVDANISKFNWVDIDSSSDISICHDGYFSGRDTHIWTKDKKNSINDMQEKVKDIYLYLFIECLYQPWIHCIASKTWKYESILNALDGTDLKQQVIDRDFDCKKISKFIINNKYLILKER